MDKNTNISPNFKLYEFCSTSKGAKYVDLNAQHGIKHIDRLQALCTKILEPLRAHVLKNYGDRYGIKGLRINSGIRCPELNALTPGASTTSQHIHCEACDVYMPDFDTAADIYLDIKNGKVEGLNVNDIAQAILERTVNGGKWIHISVQTDRWAQHRKAPAGKRPAPEFIGTMTGKPKSYVPVDDAFVTKYRAK